MSAGLFPLQSKEFFRFGAAFPHHLALARDGLMTDRPRGGCMQNTLGSTDVILVH